MNGSQCCKAHDPAHTCGHSDLPRARRQHHIAASQHAGHRSRCAARAPPTGLDWKAGLQGLGSSVNEVQSRAAPRSRMRACVRAPGIASRTAVCMRAGCSLGLGRSWCHSGGRSSPHAASPRPGPISQGQGLPCYHACHVHTSLDSSTVNIVPGAAPRQRAATREGADESWPEKGTPRPTKAHSDGAAARPIRVKWRRTAEVRVRTQVGGRSRPPAGADKSPQKPRHPGWSGGHPRAINGRPALQS